MNSEKIKRSQGLCTNMMRSDAENAEVINYIIQEYLAGVALERAERLCDNWEPVSYLPMNFENYKYRVADRG
jgi:hypothetical protein